MATGRTARPEMVSHFRFNHSLLQQFAAQLGRIYSSSSSFIWALAMISCSTLPGTTS
jgi:hypothetical protein